MKRCMVRLRSLNHCASCSPHFGMRFILSPACLSLLMQKYVEYWIDFRMKDWSSTTQKEKLHLLLPKPWLSSPSTPLWAYSHVLSSSLFGSEWISHSPLSFVLLFFMFCPWCCLLSCRVVEKPQEFMKNNLFEIVIPTPDFLTHTGMHTAKQRRKSGNKHNWIPGDVPFPTK